MIESKHSKNGLLYGINGQINNGLLMKHVAFLHAFTRHILT